MGRALQAGAVSLGALAGLAAAFTLAFRTGFGPVLDAIRRVNRAVLNPRQLEVAGRPGAWASVVRHVGRASGRTYRTPVVAVPVGDGFVFALPYGAGADWVRNVLAAGGATLEHEGEDLEVGHPRLLSVDEARAHFPAGEQRLQRLFGIEDFLAVTRT